MKKWGLLVVLMLVLGMMEGIAAADAPDSPAVVVNNHNRDDLLALRAEPRSDARRLGEYPNGTTAWLLDEQGDWSHVRLGDGTEGYFLSARLVNMEALTRTVELVLARDREDWNRNYPAAPYRLYAYPLDTAPSTALPTDRAATLTVLEPFGTWYRVRTVEGEEGYVPCNAVEVSTKGYPREILGADTDVTGYGIVNNPDARERLHLRAEPSRESASLGRFLNGTQLEAFEAIEVDGEYWYSVRINGQKGYMLSEYINFVYPNEETLWGNG
ncbi:MAG: SH3 domain-containing protein [Oscillospiraceae bacterium]|nr:SH3 domain-containing protein [Oscillospiraceae bacterium]